MSISLKQKIPTNATDREESRKFDNYFMNEISNVEKIPLQHNENQSNAKTKLK